MKVLVTGGGGFIGGHTAEYFAEQGHEVTAVDAFLRGKLLKKEIPNLRFNKKFLEQKGVRFVEGDINDLELMKKLTEDVDTIIHTAAQTAVTVSVEDPRPDFESNCFGTFNVLEAARKSASNPAVIYCSTNKVYGDNVNSLKVVEKETTYSFDSEFSNGVPESLSVDLCEHTPYGSSKLSGDIYAQDYAHLYGIKTGVFRMSCIYGTRQFGVEDQGWVAWFTIATLLRKPITIYGDGKQVRDVLYVTDLLKLWDKFLKSNIKHEVFNTGGGPDNTLSLLELLDILEKLTGLRSEITYADWRPSDQKVFIADVAKAEELLGWKPETAPRQGVKLLVDFVSQNKRLF